MLSGRCVEAPGVRLGGSSEHDERGLPTPMDCAALVRITHVRIIKHVYRDSNLLKFRQGGVMLFERAIQDVLVVAGNAA